MMGRLSLSMLAAMGALFAGLSSARAEDLLPETRRNRQILQAAMERRGFKGISAEWWHFKLAQEPTTNAFDIPVH